MNKAISVFMEPLLEVSKPVIRTPVVPKMVGPLLNSFPLDQIERNTSHNQFCNLWMKKILYELYLILIFCILMLKGQTKVGENLMTNDEYSDTLGLKAKENAKQAAKDHFGFEIPQELVISTKKASIGLSILKAMKTGGGESKKVIGASLPEKKQDFDLMVEKEVFFFFI